MKIEKVNDNQIRCTLTKEDLASRQIKISELAYGTEKAKNLFRDMMQQANYEFGFEAEDIPLMIEAIPMNAECIVLIITKVEDPEELDTRFSRFAPSVHEDSDIDEHENDIQIEGSNEILDLFRKIQAQDTSTDAAQAQESVSSEDSKPPVRLFRFETMHALLSMANGLQMDFNINSSLYKSSRSNAYLLLLTGEQVTVTEYNKLCNRISEYGTPQKVFSTTSSYLAEHCECLIEESALETLANI